MINRTKTGESSRIPMFPEAVAIMEKYSSYPIVQTTDKALPVPTNQKFNSYLKEIADLCGINKNLTVHTARHTFATTVTLENGASIESVSKMLGHSDIKTTQIYAKVTDTKVNFDMENVMRSKRAKDNENKLDKLKVG